MFGSFFIVTYSSCIFLTTHGSACMHMYPNIRWTWNCWSKSRRGHKVGKGTGALLLWSQAKKAGAVQPREEKVTWRPHSNLLVSEQALQGSQRGTLHQNCRNKTKNNEEKLKKGKVSLDIRNKFITVTAVRYWNRFPREIVDVPSPKPGSAQGQVGWGSEEPDLVEDVRTRWFLRSSQPKPFYGSTHSSWFSSKRWIASYLI